MKPEILVETTRPSTQLPEYGTALAACADIRAHLLEGSVVEAFTQSNSVHYLACEPGTEPNSGKLVIPPGWRAKVPTGLSFYPPEGYSLRTHPRSGLSTTRGLTVVCGEGVIDEDYQKELIVPLINLSDAPLTILHGERIAQIEAVEDKRATFRQVEELPGKSSSRSGGFGHTGSV